MVQRHSQEPAAAMVHQCSLGGSADNSSAEQLVARLLKEAEGGYSAMTCVLSLPVLVLSSCFENEAMVQLLR